MNKDTEVVIEAGKTTGIYWSDVWRYRELFFFLAWRDLLVRYKQTIVGLAWSLLKPLLTMMVFTAVFSRLAGLPSHGVPYPIIVYAALLPWQFFSTAVSEMSGSLVDNANLLTKIYFPRLIVPTSSLIVAISDMCISIVMLALLMLWYRFSPDWHIVFLPIFLLSGFLFSFGCGIWVAALNVRYRDFRYVVPFMLQLGLYVTPVGFSSSIVPPSWRFLYSVNPMVGVIEGVRWSVTGRAEGLYWPAFLLSLPLILVVLLAGLFYFRRMERTYADIV